MNKYPDQVHKFKYQSVDTQIVLDMFSKIPRSERPFSLNEEQTD